MESFFLKKEDFVVAITKVMCLLYKDSLIHGKRFKRNKEQYQDSKSS